MSTDVTAARRTAERFVDGLRGLVDVAQSLAPGAKSWAPHLGWAAGDDAAVAQLRNLRDELAVGRLTVEAVVAAADLVVVEAMLERASGTRAPVTATLELDSDARVIEVRIYLDPHHLAGD